MRLQQIDIDFILAQLRAPSIPAVPIDSTGIRDVRGTNNNVIPGQEGFGAVDHLFPRLTTPEYTAPYANPVGLVVDPTPRIISNLVSTQIGDNPNTPVAGVLNPLPYSSWMTLLGQFFDHGLDLVHKGETGYIRIDLMPGDPLYVPGSPNNFMMVSRTNTGNVTIGEGTTDSLAAPANADGVVGLLGIAEGVSWTTVTGTVPLDSSYSGTLVLNNQIIELNAASGAQVVDAINAKTGVTGVVASLTAEGALSLVPASRESSNTISPFIDLSQSYGSAPSHTVFLREYDVTRQITGRLVSGADHDGDGVADGMATWADIKANAARLGITLHDYNVEAVPLVRLNPDGTPFIDAGGAYLVALHRETGALTYIQDSSREFLAANDLVLMDTGHAFLDDIAHDVMSSRDPVTGRPTSNLDAVGDIDATLHAGAAALLDAHYVAGDGRTNENIGLTAIHDVFHAEHNRLVADIRVMVQGGTDSQGRLWAARPDAGTWTGEDFFQAAKLVTEMEYQHMIFDEFARKLSPNIDVFGQYDITLDPAITAEFAHAVYRFGHSMLTETVDRIGFGADGIADPTLGVTSMRLFDAFLNPLAYEAAGSAAAGQIALGMSRQVGNEIDEFVTDALQNTLVGLPLDLAAINIARGRDTGIPSLNGVRTQLYQQTGDAGLAPYTSWADFGRNLLHPESLKNFIMAYARDSLAVDFGNTTVADWDALRVSAPDTYALQLSAAADAAMANVAWMNGGNSDYNTVDLWLGGLAERKVIGGMLGSTFDFVFATQMLSLQNADRFYYLERLAGTNLLAEIEAQRFADIVMRNTGVRHLYTNIFAVPDAFVEIGDPTTYGPLSADPGAGFSADGTFQGSGLSEVIGGTIGVDRINAGAGADAVYGDEGNDILNGGVGDDFVHGGAGDDLITDTDGADQLWGDDGNDTIHGELGLDLIFGGLGNDSLRGGVGLDVLDGGEGDDVLYGDGDADALSGGLGDDILYGGNGDDALSGDEGNDILFGDAGADILTGLEGDDWFMHHAADLGYNNIMDGGLGIDTASYENALIGVTIDLGNGGNAVAPIGVNVPDAFIDVENLIGSRFNDTLTGNEFANSILGGIGNDLITGAELNDTIDGGDGSDVAAFSDVAANYSWTTALVGGISTVTITHNGVVRGRSDGTDTLRGIETLRFIDGDRPVVAPTGSITLSDTTPTENQTLSAVSTLAVVGATMSALSYQWQFSPNGGTTWVAIPGATQSTFVPNDPQVGRLIRVSASFSAGGLNFTFDSPASAAVVNVNDAPTGAVTLNATAPVEGMVLTAANTVNDADGLAVGAISYRWEGSTNGGTTWTTLGTGASMTVGAGHAGMALRAVAVYTDGFGTTETVASVATNPVPLPQASNWTGTAAAENRSGTAFDDMLSGLGGNDTLLGLAGNDTLDGGSGNDSINGGAGADRMIGGSGSDTFVVDDIGDVVIEAAGGGTDTVRTSLGTYVAPTNVEHVAFIGSGAFVGTGNTLANSITGSTGDDHLDGLGGADTMIGGAGNDTYVVDNGADVVTETANQGIDLILTSRTTYSLGANVENLTFTGTGAFTGTGNGLANRIIGGTGADLLSGGGGNDTLDGAAGGDRMSGGAGNDTYRVDSASDVVIEATDSGTDTVISTFGSVTLAANVENLVYEGTGAFTGVGNTSANAITGGAGSDRLEGGTGADTLTGGAGADTFVIRALGDSTATARDLITDFGVGDRIDLSLLDANATSGGNQAFTFGTGAITGAGQVRARFDAAANLTLVEGNVHTTNTAIDFQIALAGNVTLTAAHFVL